MNRTAWQSTATLIGACKALLEAIKDSYANLKQYNHDFFPSASEYKGLCMNLGSRSHDWWGYVAKFLDDELLTLEQWGIPDDKVYIVVCDEIQIILHKIFEKRMKMQVFSTGRDHLVYMAGAFLSPCRRT
jgi:hypothetical protein